MMEYNRKRKKYSQYMKGEEVFIRYGKKENWKKTPKKRYVILGEVVKKQKQKQNRIHKSRQSCFNMDLVFYSGYCRSQENSQMKQL